MIEIRLYRYRIGTFSQKLKNRKSCTRNIDRKQNKQNISLRNILQIILRIVLIMSTVRNNSEYSVETSCNFRTTLQQQKLSCSTFPQDLTGVYILPSWSNSSINSDYRICSKKTSVNFQARYKFGNQHQRSKGIKNFHLNVRSLGNKISEIKNIVKQHSPHILGISESELRKVQNTYDEKKLKVPGYDLLFPKSWGTHGHARVVVYVKSSLHYQQVHELEGDVVQSVWLKGGFKNSKKVYYCHAYREHSSSLGDSIQSQRQYFGQFLEQWEEAATHSNAGEPNEVHIAGDMNIDVLDGKWLRPDYHLVTLSRMLQSECNIGNFSQLVTEPTRSQFNSIKGSTDISCIDHVYTNYKFRCSKVIVEVFGASDHDLLGYTRFSKDPPAPAKTIRKRTYKNFDSDAFLADLRQADWSAVYQCQDVDDSTAVFTRIFKSVLDQHAPWIVFQQRKHYVPWLTMETEELMKSRNNMKKEALNLAKEGKDSTVAWAEFKKLRNKVNNRRKFEEKNFKKEKVNNSLHSPTETWKTAKSFMDWESSSGPPSQLSDNGKLVTKASEIATEMNNFFMEKVRLIREGISFIPNRFIKCLEIMQNKTCKLSMKHVSISKVNKLLKKLKNSKSTSIDELDNFCVKVAADVIAEPLHHIITQSILQQKFPTLWKYSKVIPLHKKESKLERIIGQLQFCPH